MRNIIVVVNLLTDIGNDQSTISIAATITGLMTSLPQINITTEAARVFLNY